VVLRRERKTTSLAFLVPGDYFGEESLLRHSHRTASVYAREKSLTLVLLRPVFNQLLKKVPRLRANFEVAVESRRLTRTTRFKWIRPGESIYFLARKHPVVLYQSLAGPLFALTLPIFSLVFYFITNAILPLLLAGLSLLIILGWMGWKWLDWSNDYYIVTNQRVVWLEKVIGVYDSRQEAPLGTVLSVGVETDQLGRIMDYGNVIVRTFVGRIPFNHVHRPHQAAQLIEEHWGRSREGARRADVDAMKNAIRDKLGLPTSKPAPAAPDAQVSPMRKPSLLRVLFASLFRLRIEESGGTITYRKHYFVLVRQIWQPTLLLLLLLGGLIYHLFWNASHFDTLAVVLLFFAVVDFGWWVYQYVDWSNDKFQVTADQILDLDKTPFGKEERKSAPLDNILSTEYRRVGVLQILLNYGDVVITVGGTQLIFENVQDPPSVQQDIDQRRVARLESRRQGEVAAERDKMATWLAAYHRNAEEFRRDQALRDSGKSEVK
jgi:hypothetical protein